MSGSIPAFDPYRSPEDVQQYAPPTSSGQRPKFLTFIVVMAILLGAMGLMSALSQVALLVFYAPLLEVAKNFGEQHMNDQEKKIQKELYDELNALFDKYIVQSIIQVAFHGLVSITLLWGGVKAMGLQPAGRTILVIACACAAVFVVARNINDIVVAFENMPMIEKYSRRMIEEQERRREIPEGARRIAANSPTIGKYGFITATTIMNLSLLFFYLCSFRYLNKEKIRILFQTPVPGTVT